jgi:hypothetical protein
LFDEFSPPFLLFNKIHFHLGSLHQDEHEGLMLMVYDVVAPDTTYQLAIDTIHAMGEVVDGLYGRARKLKGGGGGTAGDKPTEKWSTAAPSSSTETTKQEKEKADKKT